MENKSQEERLLSARNARAESFAKCRSSILSTGRSNRFFYNSKAIEEAWRKFEDYKIPAYDTEYTPNPFYYQYDLELFIFINWKELLKREFELEDDAKKIRLLEETKSPTLMTRQTHLANAATIRWPNQINPQGVYLGNLAITPWLMDYFYGVSNYNNVIEFGGAGQGKTYGPLAFMCMIYDYFIYTQKGAQCTFSTVTEGKIKGSTWPYLNRLYPISSGQYQFSLYAGKAKKGGGDYTYCRQLSNGKIFEQGGTLKGVLIPRGRKDSSVVDKLTGFHDPEARIYLLDEMQSTDDAPLGAFNNMFLHCKHGWFNAAGNYDLQGDLLDLNVEPNEGWDSVNENTHMWEGTIKTKSESLGHKSLVIHFNNDLSPGVTNKEFGHRYQRFVPTKEKKDKLYPTEEQRQTIAYKRFWIGFRFERDTESKENILTDDLLKDTKAHEDAPEDYYHQFNLGSFDSAPASLDRNVMMVASIGTTSDGYPMVVFKKGCFRCFSKPKKQLEYYKKTVDNIIEVQDIFKIQPGHLIMDWTARSAHIELLAERGYPCHHLIYHEKIPDKPGISDITGAQEDKIPIDTISVMVKDGVQKDIVHYAHQVATNKITLGAYVFRWFVEQGRVRGINASLLTGLNTETFEKEFLRRCFLKVKRKDQELLSLDSKEEFKKKYGFSPDLLDVIFQLFYMIFYHYNVKPNVPGLGKLIKNKKKKEVDKTDFLWKLRRDLRV